MDIAALWLQCGLKCFVQFFLPSPVHSNRTSPSLTLQTKALSSSPPVTAMLFVAGSKLTQKTEPGTEHDKKMVTLI